MSLPTVKPFATRQLYIYGVIVVTLFVMAFVWFICFAVITPVRTGITAQMTQYNSTNTYGNFELADTFMSNLWAYILVITVLGLLYWVYHYSQRKGTPMVMYE